MNKMSAGKLILLITLIVVFIASSVFVFLGINAHLGINPANARKSIVWVREQVANHATGERFAVSGTGFCIGKPGEPVEYIVTNGHVVKDVYNLADPQNMTGQIEVFYSLAENDSVTPKVVYYSPPEEYDIAILKLPSPTTKRTPLSLRNSDEVNIGETAYALGYPGVASDMQDYITFDENDITVTKGIISKRTSTVFAKFEAFQLDVYTNHGNSGGPLLDDKGFVLGVNTLGAYDYYTEQFTDINYASVSNQLIKILDHERIAYTLKGQNNVFIFIFAPLAVLSLAGIILILTLKKKNVVANAKTAPNKKKNTPVLRGVAGKYSGDKFECKNKLTLGRDSSQCNIVFDSNTPGISSNHCSIYYDNVSENFVLTDNGSTYGTFLANGKKLTASSPVNLSVGDSFYLADGTNRFIVSRE